MPSKSNWGKALALVDSDPTLRPFRRFLLNPDRIHNIVCMTNAGHVKEARNFIDRAVWLLGQIQRMDPEIDLTWDYEIVADVRRALDLVERSAGMIIMES